MDVEWDKTPERREYGFEARPWDAAMIMVYNCDRFTLKNLHLLHSRSRGFGMDSDSFEWQTRKGLRDGGPRGPINNEVVVGGEILYCSVYRTFGPGIRYGYSRDGRLIGNRLVRPTSLSMASKLDGEPGTGEVQGLGATGYRGKDGKVHRNPPMEGVDCGAHNSNIEYAYNEICWGDKELSLIDGDVDGLRIHHNYAHNAWNLPWCSSINPNGYGAQQNIEIDHNIAHHTWHGFGVGTEGGGFVRNVRIHHNLTWDTHWNSGQITGAWRGNAKLDHVFFYNNTAFHNGHYTRNPLIQWNENKGPAGGIAVSMPAKDAWVGPGKPRRPLKGTVEDVIIANNLILQPRDYALALKNDGDPVKSRIRFLRNLTDMSVDSRRIDGKNNPSWRAVRDENLIVTDRPVLRDPAARDFRLLPGTPAVDGGVPIGPDGKPDPRGGKMYIGAFGPDSKWVERPPDFAMPEDAPDRD